jgi:hypothetical protein
VCAYLANSPPTRGSVQLSGVTRRTSKGLPAMGNRGLGKPVRPSAASLSMNDSQPEEHSLYDFSTWVQLLRLLLDANGTDRDSDTIRLAGRIDRSGFGLSRRHSSRDHSEFAQVRKPPPARSSATATARSPATTSWCPRQRLIRHGRFQDQAISPWRETKRPVPAPGSSVARATIASVPSVTVWGPL